MKTINFDMENSTNLIRTNLRENRNLEREERRFELINCRRCALGETFDSGDVINVTEIADLASKLKCKKIELKDMKILKQAFIESEDNIRTFLKINGALHALVREVSGHNTTYKVEAINCCCNLGLGNEKAGVIIAKAVAPYLISQLDTFSDIFSDISVWTLGNIAGSGAKAWAILKSQGFLLKLLQLISSRTVLPSTVYALTMYTWTGFTLLQNHEFEAIAADACLLLTTEPSVYWLIYLLSCTEICDSIMLKNFVISNAFNILCRMIVSPSNENDDNRVLNVTALLRVIGNLCGGRKQHVEVLMHKQNLHKELLQLFAGLLVFPSQHIKCESLWVIGNIAKHLNEPEMFLSELEPNLSIAIRDST